MRPRCSSPSRAQSARRDASPEHLFPTPASAKPSSPFEVRVQLTPVIRIEVRDASEHLPSVMAPRTDAERGRGLRIVNELASSWGVEPELGGKVVWF